MLPFQNRLKNKEDFEKTYRYGKSLFCDKLVMRVAKNGLPVVRVGISIGVNFSKSAVLRNQLKRQIRAFFRAELEKIKPGQDIVIILQKGYDSSKSPVEIISKLLAKSGQYI
ncbi:MAG: ribonuclease P protein component [Candidatus Moraniibacteriota bacterium]